MGKRKRARSAAVPPVHNAHLVLPSALELHMAPINLACVAACVNQSSSSQPMPTRAECPPGICPRPQFQCGQFSTTGGSKSGDVAYLAGQRQPAERERGGTDDSLKAPNDSHPSLVRPGTFKRCREQLEISW